MPEGAQIFLFREKIKPVWEDQANINGGRFVIRTKRGFANKLWEDLLVAQMVDGLEDVCGVIAHTKKTYI